MAIPNQSSQKPQLSVGVFQSGFGRATLEKTRAEGRGKKTGKKIEPRKISHDLLLNSGLSQRRRTLKKKKFKKRVVADSRVSLRENKR